MKETHHKIYYPLLFLLIILAIISCVAISSAKPIITYANPGSYVTRQIQWYIISFVFMFLVYKFGVDRIYSSIWILYGLFMLLLAGLALQHLIFRFGGPRVIPFASRINGATSWYIFPGIGSFQPSEFMKIILIITLSRVIHEHNELYQVHTLEIDFKMILKVLKVALPPCLLIYLQNDSGVMLIIFASLAAILYDSGIQTRWFIVGGLLLGGFLLLAAYIFIFHSDIFSKFISGYKLKRFYGWLAPEATYGDEGYQLFNALLSIGTAGLLGHGYQSYIKPFPEAQTDFIFAVIAQGSGFIGAAIVIICIALFDITLLKIGLRSQKPINKYFSMGILGLLLFQQVWNICMILGLLPITGITLPFISYGGSSLLSYMLAMGMFFSIEEETQKDVSALHKYTS